MTSQRSEMRIHGLTGEPYFLMASCDLALAKGKEQIAEELQANGYGPKTAKVRAQEILNQACEQRAARSDSNPPTSARLNLDIL